MGTERANTPHSGRPSKVPQHFWQNPDNRREFLQRFARANGFRKQEDWYQVRDADLIRFGGHSALALYDHCAGWLISATFPELDWAEWRFPRVPYGFWRDERNRARYFRWLAAQLGYTRARDWARLTRAQLLAHRGRTLYKRYGRMHAIRTAARQLSGLPK